MATKGKKCKLLSLSVCVLILHSISFCAVSSHKHYQRSPDLNDLEFSELSHIRHIRHRLKRDVVTQTVERTIPENAPNPIFTIRNEVTDPSLRVFEVESSSIEELFEVDSSGQVRAKQTLDYENESMRQITLVINARNANDATDIIRLEITIRLQAVNDEKPVFKNQPYPFLATVPSSPNSGIKIFELYAEDPDGNDVVYELLTGSESRFQVRTNTIYSDALGRNIIVGDVLTVGSGTLGNTEYQLVIQAADSQELNQASTETVFVKVGIRPPQFYETEYIGKIPEESLPNQFLQDQLKVQAKSFQEKSITYSLFENGVNSTKLSPYFMIESGTGIIKTTSTLAQRDLDYESVPKAQRPVKYFLTVKATEAETNQISSVPLTIELTDNNDNDPIFEYSSYQITIPEDHPLNQTIITVKATDDDSGSNAQLQYSVNDGNFSIVTVNDSDQGYIGYIQIKVRLDYDRIVGHSYLFKVYAYDNGSPPRSGSADVRVTVTNVNDEPPEIQVDESTVYSVREDTQIGYVVTFLQATDLDGDRVRFYFTPSETTSEIFSIVPDSGLIKTNALVPDNVDMYVLNVTVKDDGSCCSPPSSLSSQAHIIVEIVDVNQHKPSFPNCSIYNNIASIPENEPRDTPVITVKAVDEDRNENGRVTYTILRSSIATAPRRFNIHPDSGLITSLVQFDREQTSSYSITVQGNDQASPSLEGFCTFRIQITDVNDNTPVFDQPRYTANILQSYEKGQSVANVRAEDDDIGENAAIEYFLTVNPEERFTIDGDAGIIYLNKSLGTASSYALIVMAKDRGVPPLNSTVSVTIKVTDNNSKPPTWNRNDYDVTPFTIEETAPNGFVIANFSAQSNVDNPNVLFNLIDNDGRPVTNLDPFDIVSQGQRVLLRVSGTLDYNTKKSYELRLRVTNYNLNPLYSEISPKIILKDMNNKVPYFVGKSQESSMYPGSVAENLDPGQTVIDVKAFDDDAVSPNNELTFSIVFKEGVSNMFSIRKLDANTARISTTQTFNREEKDVYFIEVKVEDGKASDIPNHIPVGTPNSETAIVQVRITDQNDNTPYFPNSTYTASVREDAGIQTSVIMVTARDPDTADVLTYSITGGNTRNAFGVQTKKGIIFVARQLDYEKNEKRFDLTLMVSDTLHTNTTTVTIFVEDVNDNRPIFSRDTYSITDVVEEDITISPQTPRILVRVSATDADLDRPNNITYSLLGYGTIPGSDQLFSIDPKLGDLYLLRPLDRDLPDGRATYQFNVRAMDEPQNPDTAQFGFASVEVKPLDINDNAPFYPQNMKGSVKEHAPKGTPFMTVIARDYDFKENGTVIYRVDTGPAGGNMSAMHFAIDNNGLISTNADPKDLDRESVGQYTLHIIAYDQGPSPPQSGTSSVIITLTDINDQVPVFQQKIYQVTMSEAQSSEEIALVKATDNDTGDNAKLTYALAQIDREHFSVTTINNEGSIMVYKAVDYENKDQRFFNLTVTVSDPNPAHTDVAYVEVTVEDFNDNKPVFEDKTIRVTVPENIPVGRTLATFSATDADSGVNALFTYHIDSKTDKLRQFSIDENNGEVTVRRELDRETQEIHDITILAIDKGDPPQTGTANLIVTLEDVNDNYPIFKEDYRPIVMENNDNFPAEVIRVQGKDLDTPKFGPPFGFQSPRCADNTFRCPCANRPTCQSFNLTENTAGDGGNGEGIVFTLQKFDREAQKFYYMPIVMWDMRGTGNPNSQTGTNTLTIEIGDINDNVQKPGHQDIFVYNYKGQFNDIVIGTVYAPDPDDWDVVDKTFKYISPSDLSTLFLINENSGEITMGKNVPVNQDYTFRASVYDRVFDVTVESTITVTVAELTEEAVLKSGAMRLTGTSAEAFIERVKKDNNNLEDYEDSLSEKFRKLLASKISTPVDNVEVISVMNNGDYTDVRYSAHGSPYYDASKTDGVISHYKSEFEQTLGINIAMIPIDECRDEKFEGGCYNYLNVTGRPALINTNGTSFVGVETEVVALEGCRSTLFPEPQECTADYCYNGGECVKDDWGGLSCRNCPSNANGPRCQGTHQTFNGNSYSLYKPLEQCEDGYTSIDFITQQESGNALIFYNGPITELGPDEPTDFISLELSNGYPKLRIDHGTGETSLQIDGRDQFGAVKLQPLNDGKWHHIDIIRKGRNVELIVDRCEVVTRENDITTDDSACRKTDVTPNENIFLNVNTLLQVGGRAQTSPPSYPAGITSEKFNGCVKNLFHNGQLYNLYIGGTPGYPAGYNGCKREDEICGIDNNIPVCGDNGNCISSWSPPDYTCSCKPGFRGNKCELETTTKDLRDRSYLQWQFTDQWFNDITPWKLHMQMMFRTRDPDGVLMTVSTSDNSKHVTLEISKGILQVKYDLGNSESEQFLQLYYSPASNGRWHLVELERYGKQFYLKMDGGEGRNYNFTLGKPGEHEGINIQRNFHAGASVSQSSGVAVITSDLTETCLNDIRINDGWLPMQLSENSDSKAATLLKASRLEDQCIRDDCKGVTCPEPRVCYPLWGMNECRCPDGYKDVDDVCVKILFCDEDPCVAGYCDVEKQMCICNPDWSGDFCHVRVPDAVTAGLTTGAIVAIVFSIFIALILTLVVIFLVRIADRPKDDKYILEVDPDDDIRENVMNYDEEGAGEEDARFDMNKLKKPDDSMSMGKSPLDTIPRTRVTNLGRAPRPGEDPDVGGFIDDRLGEADDDPNGAPADSVCEYAYEGGGSDAGSLSSLNTTSSDGDQDYDYLNDLGPKFRKLADMYGAGQED